MGQEISGFGVHKVFIGRLGCNVSGSGGYIWVYCHAWGVDYPGLFD
jgi:hypothetical protein